MIASCSIVFTVFDSFKYVGLGGDGLHKPYAHKYKPLPKAKGRKRDICINLSKFIT